MAKDPAFLFYSSDFLNGVADLTMEERGQYITLLCLQHQKGELTEKTTRLSVGSVSVDVLNKFRKLENGNYSNDRLCLEIEKRQMFTESRRINGIKGGRPLKETKKVNVKGAETEWVEMLDFFDYSCLNCGVKFDKKIDRPTQDHIVAQSLGGLTIISNLQPLCRECNSSKCADHSTDYRLRFINEIPNKYKTIWFAKDNLMEDVNINEDVIVIKDKSVVKIFVLDNISLFQKEIDKSKEHFGESYLWAIQTLSNYKHSTGKKYKSDYHTLMGWVNDKLVKDKYITSNKPQNGKFTTTNERRQNDIEQAFINKWGTPTN